MRTPFFCIPSHDRSNYQPTLEYLESLGVPKEQIFMCVWDTEIEDYKKLGDRVNRIFETDIHNLAAGRNVFLKRLPYRSHIVMLDDDISYLSYLQNGKLVPLTVPISFRNFIDRGFLECDISGTVLWGLYPVHNTFFMKQKVSDWALIIGTFLGIINKGMQFDIRYTVKEDIDFSCRVLKEYGKVIRYDMIAPKAKHYSKGGCEKQWQFNPQCFELLMQNHADILRSNSKREGEVLLKTKVQYLRRDK